jgi:predicted RNase H-like HicB family nuclease
MSIEREYEIVLQPEPEGGFSVFVPELPSVATQGETIKEATAMAKEAIEAHLEAMHEDGLPIPTVYRSRVAVSGSPREKDLDRHCAGSRC